MPSYPSCICQLFGSSCSSNPCVLSWYIVPFGQTVAALAKAAGNPYWHSGYSSVTESSFMLNWSNHLHHPALFSSRLAFLGVCTAISHALGLHLLNWEFCLCLQNWLGLQMVDINTPYPVCQPFLNPYWSTSHMIYQLSTHSESMPFRSCGSLYCLLLKGRDHCHI